MYFLFLILFFDNIPNVIKESCKHDCDVYFFLIDPRNIFCLFLNLRISKGWIFFFFFFCLIFLVNYFREIHVSFVLHSVC